MSYSQIFVSPETLRKCSPCWRRLGTCAIMRAIVVLFNCFIAYHGFPPRMHSVFDNQWRTLHVLNLIIMKSVYQRGYRKIWNICIFPSQDRVIPNFLKLVETGKRQYWGLAFRNFTKNQKDGEKWGFSCRRPSSSTFSNIFSSETTRPIKVKFHIEPLWDGGIKVYSNGPGHMTKGAAMPIYLTRFIFKNGNCRS